MSSEKTNYAWWNGSVVPIDNILISPFDRGLLYGDGLFETLRADKGHIWHLDLHISRLESSANELGFNPESFPVWRTVIEELINVNKLKDSVRIKILITRGQQSTLGMPEPDKQTKLVTTISFTPPGEAELSRGVETRISRKFITPQLAMHKTCNYLPFLVANEEVKADGGEIAILKDTRGRISEATTAALVFTHGEAWIFPQSDWQLPSTTAKVLMERLNGLGHATENRPVFEEELAEFDGGWLLSSSNGARPINLPQIRNPRTDKLARTTFINNLVFSL